jgi:hypothetical protein
MEHRKLGRTGLDVSFLGLGTEHIERKKETIDSILRAFVEAGLNYVDMLYVESGYWAEYGSIFGNYRKNLVVTAHWGPDRDIEKSRKCLDNILTYMGNSYIDIVMLTVVDKEHEWSEWSQKSMEHLQRYKKQGEIGFIGLSSHTASTAIKAVESDMIDVLMYNINPICHNYYQGTEELYRACAGKDVGIVAMKPYAGGNMLYLDGEPTGITPAQCLAYLSSLPVSTTVPGVRNMDELKATLHYLEATDEEKDYSSILDNIHQSMVGRCVYCNHCLPCPQDINIGSTICLADWAKAGVNDYLISEYNKLPAKASECIECGNCMERCPFNVDVISKLQAAAEIFETQKGM